MTRPKRKPHAESSSDPFWPWVMGVAILLVLLVGIGLGVALTGGAEGTEAKAKNPDPDPDSDPKENGEGGSTPGGTGVDIGSLLNGTGTGNPVVPPPKANSKLLQFISNNRVYLLPTTNGRYEFGGKDLENHSDQLGDFFKALKAHDQKHGAYSTDKNPPTEFSPATYTIGIDPINLKASQIIKYSARGGTLADPAHYHLDKMTIVMHKQNPANKIGGIYFQFPNWAKWGQAKHPWIHVAGKTGSGIKPFYLVPLETTQPDVALINLKVGDGIQFDDAAMTAKVKPEIVSAMKKLLKDNDLPEDIIFRAGAPLAKWGYAHVNGDETIDFKKTYLEPKKAAAKLGGYNPKINAYVKWTNNAIEYYFPAAQEAMEAQKRNDFQKTLEKTEKYAKFSMQFVKRGSPIPWP
jgi:hypothetical protein